MARRIYAFNFLPSVPEMTERLQACEDFKRIFGWKPESVEANKQCRGLRGAFSLRVRVGLQDEMCFTLARGLLVGVFPKGRY
jgi:hypothetical protein